MMSPYILYGLFNSFNEWLSKLVFQLHITPCTKRKHNKSQHPIPTSYKKENEQADQQ